MESPYIQRTLEPALTRAAAEFPAVVVTGPRQSGKTTLLRRLFNRSHAYVSLEPPDVRDAAATDPRGFLAMHQPPVILDEIQGVPDLLPYIKESIDARRDDRGQYLLTGSQNLQLLERVSESLAGRAAMLRLLPLSFRERARVPHQPLAWETQAVRSLDGSFTHTGLWEYLVRGGFPELTADPARDAALWHSSYVQTYLERDVRSVRQVGDLTSFQSFVRALAARHGQLLSLSAIAKDLGIAVNTVKAWLSVLEATFQIIILRPYFANVTKRLVKTPKVYFADSGTLCHIANLRDPLHAASGPMGGAIFEGAVLMEIVKAHHHRGETPQVYFWRTSTGEEVDFLIDLGTRVVPIEVKLSATPRPPMADGIKMLQRELGERVGPGYIVHPGDVRLPLAPGVTAIPFADL